MRLVLSRPKDFADAQHFFRGPHIQPVGGVEPLAKFFHDAEMQVRSISAPSSLSRTHGQYVGAMALYANAAAEMLKFAEDGDSQHLGEAHRMDVRASEDMLRVGEVLWPGQYKPH